MACNHTREESWWEYDGYGIPLCRVCDRCEEQQMKRYRRDIKSRYECDEPIEFFRDFGYRFAPPILACFCAVAALRENSG